MERGPGTPTDYHLLVKQIQELAAEEPSGVPLMANTSAVIMEMIPGLNWAGFYLKQGDRLILGPFQGKTACIHIPWGKGVCGTAAEENRSVRVPDVHIFPGHIACDSASRSELVIPLRKEGTVFGVLDLDSPEPDHFSERDQKGLERIVHILEESIVMEQPTVFELRAARHLAADHLSRVLRPGDTAIDATMGNGYDTCRMAKLVGSKGRVYAFDIQEKAVSSARDRLEAQKLMDRVTLIREGHEHMADYVNAPVRAVTFNLGWLPGGDKTITTHWETTGTALEHALKLLMPMGICTICVYPGHPAGEEERIHLTEFLAALRPQEYNVMHEKFLNAGPDAPECFVIQRC